MGVVKLADYRKPQQEVMERQVADIEDGYTRIANDLLDAIMSNNFTVRQMKLLLAVIRKTYGFNKKFDWISGEQFSEMTGMPRTRCSSTKTELLNMKVLVTEGRKVGINKVISDWCVDRPERRREYGSTKHKAGYIYVFAEDEFGPVKIGFTTRDAEERLKEVKYYFEGNNPKVFYVSTFHLHAGAIEPLVHEAMKEQMIRGEMFETTVTQAINKINAVMEYFTPSVTNSVTPSVNHDLQREVHTKDNTQNTLNTNTPLPPEGGDVMGVNLRKRKPEVIDYHSFLEAYNSEVGDRLPHAVSLNDKRKRRIKKIIPQLKTPNIEGFRAYIRAFVQQAKPFYFGVNDSGWTADIDYLLRDETLTGVREAKFADRGMA